MSKRKRDDDDDAFDERGILRDQRRTSVMQYARDAFGSYPFTAGLRAGQSCTVDGAPGHLVKQPDGTFLCVPDDETEDSMSNIKPDATATVCDAFGRSDPISLSQPGPRYLTAGRLTVDHALQVTQRHLRDQAFADNLMDMSNAWKGTDNTREVARIHNTGNARTDAYLDMKAELQTAWMKGTGR